MALLYKGVAENPENGLRVRLGYSVLAISGDHTVTNQDAQFLHITPSGSDRNIIMPNEAASQGSFFWIANASASHSLVIKDSAGGAGPGTIGTEKQFFVVCDGSAWQVISV
tara:strand:- start:599 stop:931 length:333 start_codon:yes stop_codon:yes gene_type:complete